MATWLQTVATTATQAVGAMTGGNQQQGGKGQGGTVPSSAGIGGNYVSPFSRGDSILHMILRIVEFLQMVIF